MKLLVNFDEHTELRLPSRGHCQNIKLTLS